MKKIIIILFSILTISCNSGDSQLEVISSDFQSQPSSTKVLKTKVIDGYISGANIFIDMNWNLTQDINEPSAYEDSENNEYYFEIDDFSSIVDFTVECAKDRPRVAEIPVGAVDSERGVVEDEYEMYFFPYYAPIGEQGEYRANVTPLTSLFMSYISDNLGNPNIEDINGCQQEANDIADRVIAKVIEVMDQLSSRFEIDVETFYDDFIASEDEQLQSYGELIVDFLKVTNKISYILEEEYEIDMRTQVDIKLIETILSGESFDIVEFALFSETPREELSDDFYTYDLYAFYGIFANSSGQLINDSGEPYELTIENLKQNSSFMIREITTTDVFIFPSKKVLLEKSETDIEGLYRFIDYSTFFENDEIHRLKISETQKELWKNMRSTNNRLVGFFLTLTNQNNPYYDEDLERIFSTRIPSELEQIFNDIDNLSSTISTLLDNRYLLYDGDYQTLENENWQYLERMNGTIEQECLNKDTNDIVYGAEAFSLCSDNLN
tara:strand:- start:139 stop:1626 length:1488 start_codon:yes stop_codon:yes gene_type:complete